MKSIRRQALERLATLSAESPGSSSAQSDFSKLCKRCTSRNPTFDGHIPSKGPGGVATKTPIGLAELEVLHALCKSAPLVQNTDTAEQLVHQISPYLPESHLQAVSSSPGLRDIEPSPWEMLTYNVTTALLSIGVNHPSLRHKAASAIQKFVQGWTITAGSLAAQQFDGDDAEFPVGGELSQIITLTISMLGFLDAAAKHASFWTALERLELIETLRSGMSEELMVAIEAAMSIVRNARPSQRGLKEWKRYTKHYAASGKPLGAILLRMRFMRLSVACASLLVMPPEKFTVPVLDYLRDTPHIRPNVRDASDDALLEGLARIASEEMERLQNDLDYLQRVSSAWQQRLASGVKADAFITFLCCSVVDEDVADADQLMSWLEATLADPVQIGDENLAATVLKSMAIVGKLSSTIASELSRSLPRILVQGGLEARSAAVATEALITVLKVLPQDVTITTLYSLGNVLSAGSLPDRGISPITNGHTKPGRTAGLPDFQATGSAISLAPSDTIESTHVYVTVIQAVVEIAKSCNDEKIAALALSMLIQKIGRVSGIVDAEIITQSAPLGMCIGASEFRSLLKLYSKMAHDALVRDDPSIIQAVADARTLLSRDIDIATPLYEIFLIHLLDSIVSKGDAHETDNKHLADTEFAAQEIAQLLLPLATICKYNAPDLEQLQHRDTVIGLQRDAWFNVVVHGFSLTSILGKKHLNELKILAQYTLPLITGEKAESVESDVELNTVLRRGKSSDNASQQKHNLIAVLPLCEADIKSLNYSEIVFLNAAYLVEHLRASSGNCTKVLEYFLDPKLRSGALGNCMSAIATAAVSTYLSQTLASTSHSFSTPYLAQQLAVFFSGCCHRIARVQQVAIAASEMIISQVPSTLCQKTALFALLELLSIMWDSCLEGETDEYEWTSTFKSPREHVSINLSDNFTFRRSTLTNFHKHAKEWVQKVLDIAPLDIKGLLQTYLSECDDERTFGHISLGRTFALEMGSIIPTTDQRLGAIEKEVNLGLNTASDFIMQYTSRQEYRFIDGLNDQDEEWLRFADPVLQKSSVIHQSIEDAKRLLTDLDTRTLSHKRVSIAELRDILRRAAALLCRIKRDQCAIVHHLVGIPFAVFTKQSIKLGISLWMNVIKENPRMESRVFIAIAEAWENTIRKRQGLFSNAFGHQDPFYIKQEFAPSDRTTIMKRQRQAYELIAPHFRLLEFLSSHFNATRLSNSHVQRTYQRIIQQTLDSMSATTGHPLAREAHFHVILLGLKVLRHGTILNATSKWRLKDRILSAALAWFTHHPRWSFGGNRVQIKAETHVLADIQVSLDKVASIGAKADGCLKSLQPKQDLLSLLLSNEQTRLMVWLFPLDYDRKHHFTSGHHSKTLTEDAVSSTLKTAWAENPALAIHLIPRFPLQSLANEVRWLLLNFPHKALHEPDALEILLGKSLADDVSFQLKYLLYWAPVNPMAAVTYFLPAYGNHPFVIQYAMRALESHSVDVTFFYVPQIVQSLRYDVLGYVERYIIETAKFSQLFAHQIIWNMKANAYKDEDSQIPDPVKPTLDKVMASLISSFSKTDRAFYEKEFSFFNEVTGISGKLRPFIKKPKPEKKQKIEEELRKIKVEVGVYLPSNPDGVVIGIDRKSGKPLQSHAKAPYMATFRIRKDRTEETKLEGNQDQDLDSSKESYEVWQSAIFKVGDDCRQDVLALQMIAAFRGIFNNVGLDVYVYPYRVTATAPGCGVIDVLPNSISRDMLGREAVNGLYEYFVSKYGTEESIRFQEARNNFVKSMAAYSVISYLLQFKDRHNGNIMIDEAGHILHIDFGFCFDIAPGGIKFERAPFKLTGEMVAVMGGSVNSQPYQWFEELCIKAFLAVRPHCEHLAHIVIAMLDSGLPCFKPETVQNFRDRFALDKSERDAADFMRKLIKKSHGSTSTTGYDRFQLWTNGIPY